MKYLFSLSFLLIFSFNIHSQNNPSIIKNKVLEKKLDTVLITYFDNGNLKSEETYKNGVLDGESKYYYENGSVKAIHYNWKKWTVYQKNYYDNGKLKSEGGYRDFSKKGEWLYYNEDGSLKDKKIY